MRNKLDIKASSGSTNEKITSALVAARECIAIWMMDRGYATGDGDTIEDLLFELEGQAKDRGRSRPHF